MKGFIIHLTNPRAMCPQSQIQWPRDDGHHVPGQPTCRQLPKSTWLGGFLGLRLLIHLLSWPKPPMSLPLYFSFIFLFYLFKFNP